MSNNEIRKEVLKQYSEDKKIKWLSRQIAQVCHYNIPKGVINTSTGETKLVYDSEVESKIKILQDQIIHIIENDYKPLIEKLTPKKIG